LTESHVLFDGYIGECSIVVIAIQKTLHRVVGNEDAGAGNPYYATGAAFLDYDCDGRLDLFIGNYLHFIPSYRHYYPGDNYPGPLDYAPQFNRLLHNNGNGTFTDVSRESGIARVAGRAMGVTVGDYNNDGWPDIFVANDTMESFLYRNNHDGTFTNVAIEQNVAFGQNGEATTAMGPVFADCHNQGWLDLFVSDASYHRYYQNGRAAHQAFFLDRTAQSGIGRVCGQFVGWGDGVFDYDNDGWKDIFICDGGRFDSTGDSWRRRQTDRASPGYGNRQTPGPW
ncbi:MAG: VCBS repeat-containing protein, partial [Planctomycetes bacterium]|nr:VCBS repeat-containing protein [Planctomycetota bacterium]